MLRGNFNYIKDGDALAKKTCCEKVNSLEGNWAIYFEKPEAEFTGSWSILKLWRKWMEETANFMRGNGVTMPHYHDKNGNPYGKRPFSANDAHELFTSRWLGEDENGNRYSWKLRTQDQTKTPAPKGKRLYAMELHQAWALEKGLRLTNPEDSEFRKLQQQQEAV